jgi:peptidoglycan/LPS O-acetylase OafA/YrhL
MRRKWAEDRNFDLVSHFSSTTTRFQYEKTAFLFYISLLVFLPSQGSVSILLDYLSHPPASMERSLRNLISRVLPTRSANYELLTTPNSTSSPSSPTLSITTIKDERLMNKLFQFLFFLLPSFIQRRLRPSQFKPQRLYPTSYLDGLRGVASLLVCFCHYMEGNLGWYTKSYGVDYQAINGDDDTIHSSPLQLPFLRVLYSGRPMVHIFFVISGFVLSYKPLKQIRARNHTALQATLSSSVFRRGLRLFLPTTASTFMVLILIQTGWMGSPMPFWAQVWDWLHAVWKITFSWNWDVTQFLPYDTHLWTIPIEMSMSMLLFITIMGLSRCKTILRLSFLFGIMIYCLKCKHWAAFEFLGGMFIAEVGLIQDAWKEQAAKTHTESSPFETSAKPTITIFGMELSRERLSSIFWMANFIFAMWIAGWPNAGVEHTPGLRHFLPITPDPFFSTGGDWVAFPWFALGAIQVVFACQQVPFLQRVFTTGFARYLANISYALYLMHGPMLDVFAGRWMPHVWNFVGGSDGMWKRLFAFFGGTIVLGIPIIFAADLFWRAVDIPCVEFARWLEQKCIVKDE